MPDSTDEALALDYLESVMFFYNWSLTYSEIKGERHIAEKLEIIQRNTLERIRQIQQLEDYNS
jgi:hypothetical protein